ncbi:AT-hook motif nuclear-localized protein 10-like [Oryza brachyantha]|uniref:AT-hook motif nuclear-localized protein 10-like n=1 Tax=Oryza brachyantha TaxID=4533 RepID=UPI001ADA44C7|nr:AT-hook motif nuclear-localized protein 10-like [Oryza brachyantha]XP_040383408.1 AT-hook motif nuclear-localized protein 10-like [Oryza brachyantha]XP_040383410.1 AT-hook motif nuclear-localized protein 10-like [Oryza brachyantha]
MMEVTQVRASSEQGMMAGREPFGLPKSPPTPPSSGGMQSVRMAYTADGTPVFTPVSSTPAPAATYQPGGGAAAPNAGAAGGNGAPALQAADSGDPVLKKKRGRPRKYGPDGSMSLALVPMSTAAAATATPGASGPFSPLATKSADAVSSAMPAGAKKRGRPKGSTNKKHVPSFGDIGSAGAGFAPHVIFVKAGEDVSAKIMSFSQHGTRGVCVLSANGAISNVTLRQAATSGGTVTYEGRFEILSLSGSFLLSENGGHRSRTGGLSVSLAGPDGRVLGGGVAGLLTAASPVQIVVGSFNTDGKKGPKLHAPSDPVPALPKMALMSGTGPSSPPSRGTLSESSGGPGSPMNQGVTLSNHGQSGLPSMPWK